MNWVCIYYNVHSTTKQIIGLCKICIDENKFPIKLLVNGFCPVFTLSIGLYIWNVSMNSFRLFSQYFVILAIKRPQFRIHIASWFEIKFITARMIYTTHCAVVVRSNNARLIPRGLNGHSIATTYARRIIRHNLQPSRQHHFNICW